MSLSDLITHIIIEDTNRMEYVAVRAKALSAKANMVQDKPIQKRYSTKLITIRMRIKIKIIFHVFLLLTPPSRKRKFFCLWKFMTLCTIMQELSDEK